MYNGCNISGCNLAKRYGEKRQSRYRGVCSVECLVGSCSCARQLSLVYMLIMTSAGFPSLISLHFYIHMELLVTKAKRTGSNYFSKGGYNVVC